jgi:phage shock protein A
MTPDNDTRQQRLFDLLLGRGARKEQLGVLASQAQSFADFRVLLVCESSKDDVLAEVLEEWRRRTTSSLQANDDREVMHDLEVLAIKQAEVEKLLRASEASLINNLRAVDVSAAELADLGKKVREIRTAISEYRRRVSELATNKSTQEKSNGLARTGS